jgi:hypothetical protein
MNGSTITGLCDWYKTQCNDDWEHEYGIEIGTLDNPGWSLKVDLSDTDLADRPMELIKIDRSDNDWLHVLKDDLAFKAYGGPGNLDEMMRCFLSWAA